MNESNRELTAAEEEQLLRYLAGEMGREEHARFEAEILASDVLSQALYARQNLDAITGAHLDGFEAEPEAAPRRADPGPSSDGWSWLRALLRPVTLLPVAATAALVLFLVQPGSDRDQETARLRGASTTIHLVAPRDVVGARPAQFVWSRFPGAAEYQVEILTPEMRSVSTRSTTDTTLTAAEFLPAGFISGYWRVTPMDTRGLPAAIGTVAPFEIRGESR